MKPVDKKLLVGIAIVAAVLLALGFFVVDRPIAEWVRTSGIENVGFAGTKHPDVVKRFLLFASGKEAADIQARTGAVLPAYAGGEQKWMDAMPGFTHLKVFIDAKKYAVPLPVQGNAAEWQGLQTKYLTPAWDGQESASDAAAQYGEEAIAADGVHPTELGSTLIAGAWLAAEASATS